MNADLITRIATAAIRIGVQLVTAGRHRDAEALATQLEAMGPARKADVDAIEQTALGRLADAETAALTKGERRKLVPDFDATRVRCAGCGGAAGLHDNLCPERDTRVAGPLDGGD